MQWLMGGLLGLFLLAGGFLLSPSPIDSKAWSPPLPPSLDGPLKPNERLHLASLLAVGEVSGPEDTTMDAQGRLYTGNADGRILRIWPDGRVESWAETGGRPLGMVFDHHGNLIVADASRGLLQVDPQGRVQVLARESGGLPFHFTDDVAVASDGRLYFTDASSRFGPGQYRLDLLEMRPHARLLRYDPDTQKTETLMGNLYFANGVAVAPDGKSVLVNETWKYRILRYWLDGPRAGQSDVFASNLPGFPDNLAVDSHGRYWVAFPTLRNRGVDALHHQPWLKDLVAKLPESLQPAVQEYGLVMAFDDTGKVLLSLQDTKGTHLKEITSVNPVNGVLYFGSLHNNRIGRLPLTAIPGFGDLQP